MLPATMAELERHMKLLQQYVNLHMRSTNVKMLLLKLVLFQDKLMAMHISTFALNVLMCLI